jgi:hypothetical protein
MRSLLIATALASGLGLAACERQGPVEANVALDNAPETADATAVPSTWPEGARIIEEDGVFYRVDTTGTRIRLEPGDSTILVEDGVRFRVDPDGTRVRIDEQGAVISVGPDGVDATVNTGDTGVTVNSE